MPSKHSKQFLARVCLALHHITHRKYASWQISLADWSHREILRACYSQRRRDLAFTSQVQHEEGVRAAWVDKETREQERAAAEAHAIAQQMAQTRQARAEAEAARQQEYHEHMYVTARTHIFSYSLLARCSGRSR